MRYPKSIEISADALSARTASMAAAILLCGLLGACATPQLGEPASNSTDVAPDTPPDEASVTAVAEQLLEEGQFVAAANAYEDLAQRSGDPATAQHYQLTAVEVLFDNAAYADGEPRLASLPTPLISLDLEQRKQLLTARLLIVNGDPTAALAKLPDETMVVTPRALMRYHAVRADAATAAGQPGNALASRINQDLLEGGSRREERNLQIWDLLSEQDSDTLQALFDAYEDELPRGWLQLALDINEVKKGRSRVGVAAERWKARYPGHPGSALLVAYDATDGDTLLFGSETPGSLRIGAVNHVALLLPFTDRLQSFSGAIRDGAITALIDSDTNISLKVYDVGESASGVLGAYQQAVAGGANLVIGPLRRDAAVALATSANLSVPVLSLNYLNDGNNVNNMIQFGLSPEDEARNAADFIIGNGLHNAAVIHLDNDAGFRSAQAFSDRLAAWGGQVLATTELPAETADFRQQLNQLLLITDSQSRRKRLESALGTALTFETQRRTDIDAFFAPVSASLGRLLKPQLDFHNAGDVPIVSTSIIYSGRVQAEADRDINAVYFNDIPWLLNGEAGEIGVRQAARTLGVSEGPLARFFALGNDAMLLALNLTGLTAGEMTALEGQTGTLSLDNGRVRRQMPFAQFVRGIPRQTEFSYPGEPQHTVPTATPLGGTPTGGTPLSVTAPVTDTQETVVPELPPLPVPDIEDN